MCQRKGGLAKRRARFAPSILLFAARGLPGALSLSSIDSLGYVCLCACAFIMQAADSSWPLLCVNVHPYDPLCCLTQAQVWYTIIYMTQPYARTGHLLSIAVGVVVVVSRCTHRPPVTKPVGHASVLASALL